MLASCDFRRARDGHSHCESLERASATSAGTGSSVWRREQLSFEFEYDNVARFHTAVVVGVGRGLFRRALIAESNNDCLLLTSPPVLPLPDLVGRIQLMYCSRHRLSDSVGYWFMNNESIIRMAALSIVT